MRLSELIQGLDVRLADPAAWGATPDNPLGRAGARRVCDLTEDSRTAMPGSLFIARRGLSADGRAFVDEAIASGAMGILSEEPAPEVHPHRHAEPVVRLLVPDVALACAQLGERFYGDPSEHLRVCGVTGTNGKTTIAWLLRRLLTRLGLRSGLIGTVIVDDGVACAPAAMTTPPALELSRTLATMVEAGCEAASVEVSSHALSQQRVAAIRFGAAIFTNLTGDHLDYHKTMDAYADAKALLFAQLDEDAFAIVNADDPAHERMLRDCCARLVRVSMPEGDGAPAPGADVVGRVIAMDFTGCRIEVTGLVTDERVEVRVPLLGRFNAFNALLAGVCAARVTGADALALVREMASLTAPPGRLERVREPGRNEPLVLVDFAHSDDALASALRALAELKAPGARVWVVFGCGGDRDRTKRPRMGAVASTLADRVVITSDNPRSEPPHRIVDEILAGIDPSRRDAVDIHVDRAEAIRFAIEHAAPGDVVLIAGKGHERVQIGAGPDGTPLERAFDDCAVADETLDGLAYPGEQEAPRTRAGEGRRAGGGAEGAIA